MCYMSRFLLAVIACVAALDPQAVDEKRARKPVQTVQTKAQDATPVATVGSAAKDATPVQTTADGLYSFQTKAQAATPVQTVGSAAKDATPVQTVSSKRPARWGSLAQEPEAAVQGGSALAMLGVAGSLAVAVVALRRVMRAAPSELTPSDLI